MYRNVYYYLLKLHRAPVILYKYSFSIAALPGTLITVMYY